MQQIQDLLEKKRLEFVKRMDECKEKQEELRTKVRSVNIAKTNKGTSSKI
jgi:hypothetical protein